MIVFRVEAGRDVGLGHLSRCLAIAGELKRLGRRCAFVLPPSAPRGLVARPHRELRLAAADGGRREAALCTRMLRRIGAEMLVTDSYRLSRTFYEELRSLAPEFPVLAIDDAGEKASLPVYGFLAFGLAANSARYPAERLADSAIGPRYTPLRHEFLSAPRRARTRPLRRLLVTMGGSDPEGQTVRVLRALRAVEGLERIDAVLGPLYGRDTAARREAARDARVVLHKAPRRLARLMAEADAAVAAGGTTCNELTYLGVPVLSLALADNQVPMGPALERLGCGVGLGRFDKVRDRAIVSAVSALTRGRRLGALSRRALRAIDGRGAARSAEFLDDIARRYGADRFLPRSVEKEYDRASAAREDFAKAKWGSAESMLNRFAVASALARWKPAPRWLDLGCGTGGLLDFVERKHSIREFVGADLSNPVVRQAAARRRATRSARFVRAGLGDPVPGAPFDLITSLGVLQKCGIPLRRAVALLAAQLKPGGQLIVTTKNLDWRAFRRPGFKPEKGHHWFRLAELRDACALAGLRIARLAGFDPRTGKLCAPEDSHSVIIDARK